MPKGKREKKEKKRWMDGWMKGMSVCCPQNANSWLLLRRRRPRQEVIYYNGFYFRFQEHRTPVQFSDDAFL